MALEKIRLANKKWKHEQRRKKAQSKAVITRKSEKERKKKVRKMFMEGHREFTARRAAERAYIDELTQELRSND